MERRLAAVLATDVVGYSRLTEEDEEGTHATLKERRKTLFEPLIRQFRGNVVKLTGDGALVEFPSIVAAIQCAIAIQRRNGEENSALPESRRIHLRIGIAIGDIMFDEGDIYGTGVNLAARLQGVAAPGGICISGDAMEQAKGRGDIKARYRGLERLHNIGKPIEIYEIDVAGQQARHPVAPQVGPPSVPDRPSVAILPFQNIGEGLGQYFSDGMTRDLITELSRFRSLFVISANSSFRFRGRARDRTRIGQELGVRYIGDGSVQRAARQLRVTAALVDAQTGAQVWGERYNQDADEPAAVQERLAHDIAARLHDRLQHAELAVVRRKPASDLKSYELWLQGVDWHESNTPEGYLRAHELYQRAIDADPGFARAYASLAELAYMESVLSNWGQEGKDDCAAAAELAQKALALDNQDANGHAVMAWVHLVRHEFAKAARHWQLAESLNPNDADLTMWRATAQAFLGQPEQGIEAARTAMRLNPLHPDWYLSDYAVTLFFCRRFEDMLAVYDIIPELFPHTPGWRAAAYAYLGKMAEARDRAAAFTRNIAAIWTGRPEATAKDYGRWFVNCIPLRRPEEKEVMETGLRLAGLLD